LKSLSQGKGASSTRVSASKKLSTSAKKIIAAPETSLSAPKSTQKEKKAAARAFIRQTRAAAKNANQQKKLLAVEDEASDLDYGSEDNDDSDEDYDEKPWAMKKNNDIKATNIIKDSSKVPSLQNQSNDIEVNNKDEENLRTSQRKFVEADYGDFRKLITIPRRRLSRWCHEPFFEKAVLNFYVRVTVGRDPVTQKPSYKLCKINNVIVKENEEYEFPAEPGTISVCL